MLMADTIYSGKAVLAAQASQSLSLIRLPHLLML